MFDNVSVHIRYLIRWLYYITDVWWRPRMGL